MLIRRSVKGEMAWHCARSLRAWCACSARLEGAVKCLARSLRAWCASCARWVFVLCYVVIVFCSGFVGVIFWTPSSCVPLPCNCAPARLYLRLGWGSWIWLFRPQTAPTPNWHEQEPKQSRRGVSRKIKDVAEAIVAAAGPEVTPDVLARAASARLVL